ncbi:MAG: acylneuraminate cytidylyltransferase family protein [Bacteroidetes bacterium]|nr:acylneuraminate cytidylyltransferase family protein [Bacteroidota bacterium]
MKILAIIPARGGSKGVPRKNIKVLGNQPLIAYTIERAVQSKLLTEFVVSTEDAEIAEITKLCGAKVPFMRPLELAQDATPTIDVVKHVISEYEKKNIFYDAVLILQATCPFRTENEIDECIEIFMKQNTDSFISVKEVPDNFNPHWVFETNEKGTLKIATGEEKIIPRRQELPKGYLRDGSIYITKTSVIKEQNSLFGDSIAYRVNNNIKHVNIDTMSDWEQAERILLY